MKGRWSGAEGGEMERWAVDGDGGGCVCEG